MRAFVIAMESEAEAVRPSLGPGDRLYVSGVGKVNAAAATMKAICEGASEVWNAGLAGGFGPGVEVGGTYAVKSAVEYDFDLAKLNGTAKGVKNERTSACIPVGPAGKILATGDRFTDDDDDLELLASLGCELRDMEGAAIADVCDKAGVRCVMFKCVSDIHGRGSMTGQYKDNMQFCLGRLAEAMRTITGGGTV